MQSPVIGIMKKRLALVMAVLLLILALPLSAPASADTTTVRVLLSTQGATSMTVTVSGAYRLAETGDTFTGGKLTLTASGTQVTVTHSSTGKLHTGTSATIERTALSRTGG